MAAFLVVEDDALAAAVMVEAARAGRHSAVAVTDAEAAMRVIAAGGIDAAIIDWWLKPQPPGCGYTVALRARESGLAVAVVTGYPTNEFQIQGRALESCGCLLRLKPYHVMELITDLVKMAGK